MEQPTYEWTIAALDCAVDLDGLTNVVQTVHWRYRGTNAAGTTAESYGAQAVGTPNPEAFVAYSELDLTTVAGWLEATLDIAALQAGLAAQIDQLENPTHVTLPLPVQPAVLPEPAAE
jgi:hypothetical protein